jgi:quercetin dioxygenase-like cupin family protein
MRPLKVLAAIALAGCATRPAALMPPGQVVTSAGVESIEALCARHPIGADANIRADEIVRTKATSVHLVQVRGGETPHRHARHDLTVIVARGAGVLTLDGVARRMRAGDVAVVPRGASHWFVRDGTDLAVAVVTFAPPLDAPDTVPVGDVDSPRGAR